VIVGCEGLALTVSVAAFDWTLITLQLVALHLYW
jgi:hypothetical protein